MKFLLVLTVVVGGAWSEAPYSDQKPQGALLVLPQSVEQQQQQQRAESVEKTSERLTQRLAETEGSQRGDYHVYLADGRLQKVQYTAAPLISTSSAGGVQQQAGYSRVAVQGSGAGEQRSFASEASQLERQTAPAFSSQTYNSFDLQRSLSAQLPAANSRYTAFQPQSVQSLQTPTVDGERSQQREKETASYTSFERQSSQSAGSLRSLEQQTSGEPHPVIAHFGRLQQERIQQQLDQLRKEQAELRRRESELDAELERQRQFAANYVATLQFSDVAPVPSPIYAQQPAPVTRIIRQAYLF